MESEVDPDLKKPIIELKNVVKKYDDKTILKNINLKIRKNDFVTLLGPSGSGKTTILRLIGGFEWATRGEILFNGLDIKDLPPHMRDVSTIFQDYALFPHLNVENNIKYGLKLKRIFLPKESIKPSVFEKQKQLQKKWQKDAVAAMKKLDKIQLEYEKDLKKKKLPKKKLQKIQKWLDDSDFKYASWEVWPLLMNEKFEKKYLTRRITNEEMDKIVSEVIKLVGLEGHEKKSIDKLSGGQKQRVALARSIVIEPSLLLLDEPLSALDAKIREQMQHFLLDIQKKIGITFIFVTHDREEALRLSDVIVVMREGKIEQYGSPKEIYDYPINKWVANFIGDSNIFEGQIINESKMIFLNKKLKYWSKYKFEPNKIVDVLIRPEDIQIKRSDGIIRGKVISIVYKGSYYMIEVKYKDHIILIESSNEFEVGETIYLDWNITSMHLMEQEQFKENNE
ncbi:MAG: ABC transporter ATP-binding protein [Mycoplasmataceae bacterium]|nr:ABC transporter ATP-binding protein [Mycoplasmataceae bacterium]MBR4025346.1 ABC transporter ATP-binding protein [Mycoplasmataceae bacterium]